MTAGLPSRSKERETSQGPSCHSGPQANIEGMPLIAIVGNPNVGKSVLFNRLTGAYVTVSNFPGTTVEVSQGKGQICGVETGVVDTPGMYRLLPISEEERVARRILLTQQPDVVIHVVDAKNLERMLPMTLQLIEAGLPLILDVNLIDEAERAGVEVNVEALSEHLGIPVIATVLVQGKGVDQLKAAIAGVLDGSIPPADRARAPAVVHYDRKLEEALQHIESDLQSAYEVSGRATALLFVQGDEEVVAHIHQSEGVNAEHLLDITEDVQRTIGQPIPYAVARTLQFETQKKS